MNQLTELLNQPQLEIGLYATLWNFAICLVMGFVLRFFYIARSGALTAKQHVGAILPLLAAVVFLVITVVKSSLALSLGLVGALSIVRIRTPIKEPEELVYLFLAIAIGLGYGAGQTAITTVIMILMLIVAGFFLSKKGPGVLPEYQMLVDWQERQIEVDTLVSTLEPYVSSIRLVRLDRDELGGTAVLMLTPTDRTELDAMMDQLEEVCGPLKLSLHQSQNA